LLFFAEAKLVHSLGGKDPIIDLSSANPRRADLGLTLLLGANLANTNLTEADLTEAMAVINEEQHQQAASLEGATMPNGQKYEDWLKDKEGQGEDGENRGTS
jgi:uncharacterized protein YjbI with pentapeptide repeats